MRVRRETTPGLSPQTVATSVVIPAARASAASSRARSGADSLPLVVVGHLERDLRRGAVAHEAGDPDGKRVTGDVPDEHVMAAVDTRQARELVPREPRLRAAEPPLPRPGAEPCEQARHRRDVAVRKRADREALEVARLHDGHRVSLRAPPASPRRAILLTWPEPAITLTG